MLDTIDLKQRTLEHFARRQYRGKSKGTLWPSEASVEFTNEFGERETLGKCHRAVYYRLTGVTPTNPPTAWSQVIFLLGNSVEAAVNEAWKQMGIWENNSVKWEDKTRNISGEFDCILKEETEEGTQLYGVEVKSFYGYAANKIILGHWSGRGSNKRYNRGNPKVEHLLQASIYADQTRGDLAGFKLVYVSRDNCEMAEFNVLVDEEGVITVNGFRETRFTMADVYARYARINACRTEGTKPDREYTYQLTDEMVATRYNRAEISKTAYTNHTSGKERATDWHCRYCDFKDHCTQVDVVDEIVAPDALVHGSL